MRRSKLLVPARHSSSGVRHRITPKSARWSYVGFETRDIGQGEAADFKTGTREVCVVLLSGAARVIAVDFDSGLIGERKSVFAGLPWSVYMPPHHNVAVLAETDCEIAICSAPGVGKLPARVIPPSAVEMTAEGKGTNRRYLRYILSERAKAESLLIVEVITPGGNWSSYPPHRNDVDDLPEESRLEETNYHRLSPPQGFAVQRVYTEDHELDETMAVGDRDVVLVPRGYHPVSAAHGYNLYCLAVMAGPKRVARPHNDPAHEWLVG